MQLREIADHYALDDESALKTFAELQALGMVNLIGNSSAIIRSPNPKEMQEAYQVRAALEEIAGRTAAAALKGKTTVLENDARPTQRSRTAAPLQIIWSYCTDVYGSLIDRSAYAATLTAHTPPKRFDACVSMKITEQFGPESLIQTQLDLRYLVY